MAMTAMTPVCEGGHDTRLADGGTDHRYGGSGNDTYMITISSMLCTRPPTKYRTVISTIDYALGANVDNLTLLGGSSGLATHSPISSLATGSQLP